MRFAGLIGAAVFGLSVGPALNAQVMQYYWTGAAGDSNYLNAGNWAVGAIGGTYATATPATTAPGATADLTLTNQGTGRIINLNYTGAGNYTQQVFAMQTGINLGYTMNLSGTSNGRLIYNIVGRGTHPSTTPATGTSTGNASLRLSFYLNMDHVDINYNGNLLTPSPNVNTTSGLAYAYINMRNSTIDGTAITGGTMVLGGLSFDQNSSVYSGNLGMTINSNSAGQEDIWAGHLYQASTATAATQKWGTGITRVTSTGVVDHPGVFTLRAGGQYLVDGVHNGPITANNSSGAVIGGTGTINGLVTVGTGSSIGPAGRNAYGTLTINGNVNLNGALSFELNNSNPGQYDQLIINGILTPAATSSLNVGVSPTFPLRPGTFRVMTFNSITGSFGTVSLPSSQGLASNYVIGANYLDIIFSQLAYGTNPLLTGNYSLIANVIDQAVVENTVPGDLLENLNRQSSILFFKEVLDQIIPTAYHGWYTAAVSNADSTTQVITDRLGQQRERTKGSWDPYVMTRRQEGSVDATEWADYTNFDTMSVQAGLDMLVAPKLVGGAFIEYASTYTDMNQWNSRSTTKGVTGGIYGQYKMGSIDLAAIGFAGYDKYDSSRNVSLTKLGQLAKGSTTGKRLGANVSAAYTQKYSWIEVTPNVGMQVMNWAVGSFQETGANEASMFIKKQNETNVSARGGLRLAQTFSTKRGFIRPFLNAGYRRYLGDETRKIKGVIFGQGIAVTVPSVQKSALRFDAGVDWSVSEKFSAQVRYTTESGGPSDESMGLSFGVNATF